MNVYSTFTKDKVSICPRVAIVTMRHNGQNELGEEKAYSAYSSSSLFIIKESQDKTQTGGDIEAMKECCSLACCH